MLRKSNKSIKKVTIHFLKPMVLSNLKLHFTTRRSSTFSGFNLALLGLTTLPATEKTRSDLDEAAGTGKTTLTSLARRGNWVSWCFPHYSWSTEDSSSGNSWKDFVLHSVGHLELLLLLLLLPLLLLHHVRKLPLVLCLISITNLCNYIVLGIFLFSRTQDQHPLGGRLSSYKKRLIWEGVRRVIDLGFDNHSHTKMSHSRWRRNIWG